MDDFLEINELTGETKKRRSKTKHDSPWSSKRSLMQYRDMTDEQFEDAMSKKEMGLTINKVYEKRIESKINKLKEDYDFSELKPNDWNQVRSLAQCEIDLEDLNLKMYNLRNPQEGDVWDVAAYERLSKMRNDLIKSISDLQNDLQITRKVRKNDQEASVINYIEKLKIQARRFTDARMKKVICPKCGRLIGSFWFLHKDASKNKIILQCQTELESGDKCGEIITLGKEEISTITASNRDEVFPMSLK